MSEKVAKQLRRTISDEFYGMIARGYSEKQARRELAKTYSRRDQRKLLARGNRKNNL